MPRRRFAAPRTRPRPQLHLDLRPPPQRHSKPRHGVPRRGVPPALRRGKRRPVVVTQEPSTIGVEFDLSHRTVFDARLQTYVGRYVEADLHRLFYESSVYDEYDLLVGMPDDEVVDR